MADNAVRVIPEQNHIINNALGVLLETHDVSPGINCCAVCGANSEGKLLDCEECGRVCYCSAKCRSSDLQVHRRVCLTLKEMDAAGDVAYTGEHSENDEHLAMVLATLRKRGLPSAGGWEALGVSDGPALRRLSCRLSYPFSLGWSFSSLPCLQALRRRLAPSSSESAHSVNLSPSSVGGDWVDVLVLGASEAECGVRPLSMWSLCAPRPKKLKTQKKSKSGDKKKSRPSTSDAPLAATHGLRLTFVGPEVPAELHGTVLPDVSEEEGNESRPSRPCCLRYFRGEFSAFVAHGAALFTQAYEDSQPSESRAASIGDNDDVEDAGGGRAGSKRKAEEAEEEEEEEEEARGSVLTEGVNRGRWSGVGGEGERAREGGAGAVPACSW